MTTPLTPLSIDLPPQYRAADVEPAITDRWNATKAWHAEPAPSAKPEGEPREPSGSPSARPFSIVIPPPNVTAALHMGHALNNTIQDILTRYHRMLGDNAMWMPGTDHAGIATQAIVEKRVLQEEGKRRTDFEREEFVGKIQKWKDEYEARILGQLKAMGCSCDWDRTRFTMDDMCARAVREAFFQLFKDGLIYRGKRLVNWDPVTQTALSNDEVEMEEIDGQFYYLKYPLIGEDGATITVATTRPETMLGDTAVAVNPKDPARAHLIGRKVLLPIVNRIIPIIGDEYVVIPDPESQDAKAKYASGFLKVTPAHDPNDWALGQKHKLDVINVMAPDASISLDHGWAAMEPQQRENAELKPFLGQTREDARKAIVRWFKEHDLFEDAKPYKHAVGHSYRSHVPIEPYLSDQWYIDVKKSKSGSAATVPGTDIPKDSLVGLALRALAPDQRSGFASAGGQAEPWEGGMRFTPARYAKTYEQRLIEAPDWCISRQLWWGHRIPVWHKRLDLANQDQAFEFFWSDIDECLDPANQTTFATVIDTETGGRLTATQLLRKEGEDGPTLKSTRVVDVYVCETRPDTKWLEIAGFQQDPDVLDTWFSSGLWPFSTMGWPDRTPELATWNPTDVLCTAREIIVLWVARMVMFNTYFLNQLPYRDVFIHAMIQDGHGQKMSKSLGNGVDPLDIIESHGSDAMRFTLCAMTTHTQDVRMPVNLVDPHTPGNEAFEPKFVTVQGGYKVAAPVQERNGKQITSSFGVASGKAKPTAEAPLARNTSEKFDYGRNFANKLWNAVRFALTNLSNETPRDGHPSALENATLADRWILSRLVRTTQSCDAAIREFRFADYAQTLYDFFWRDLCDWYIEIVKPTVASNPTQRAVLATCLDASLRLLHPVMPFITERLWEAMNEVVPQRGLPGAGGGIELPPSEMLMKAAWPRVSSSLIDESAEATFAKLQETVSAVRNVRTTYKVPPRQVVEVSAKAPAAVAQMLLEHRDILQILGGFTAREIGPHVARPKDAAACVVGDAELYVHGLVDADTERTRLTKRAEELAKQIANLRGRLGNESYISKAPPKLVQDTKDQLATAEREAESVKAQLAAL